MQKRILFLGCGKMGGAIMQNFIKNGIDQTNIKIIDPASKDADYKSIAEIKDSYDIAVLAIKPQGSDDILKDLESKNLHHKDTVFISILAGKTIEFFKNIFGPGTKIIRLMPNLPILIGEGISAYSCSNNVVAEEKNDIVNLFGNNIELEDEALINQVTAISGSGPAYLFLFVKHIINSAIKLGLDEKAAHKLAKQTVFGASKMLLDEENIDQLINNVASKGGTTAAALGVFDKEGTFENITFEAVRAAYDRSKEL